MSFVKSFTNLFKPDDDYVDENDLNDEDFEEVATPAKETKGSSRPAGGASSTASLEMKIIKPDRFESVTSIAQHLMQRRTVVLNLEDTNKETVRRFIDFLTGVTFAIGGDFKRVANSTYVFTPKNVELSNDQTETAAEDKPASTPRDLF